MVLLARTLGPEGYGVYAFFFALVSFLAIPAQIGMPNLDICNAMTSIIIWVFALISIIPAILFHKDQNILISYAFFYMFLYTLIYKKIESI